MTPLEIACRHCDQQPGELCRGTFFHSMGDRHVDNGESHSLFHSERIEDAATMTTGEGEPTTAQFDKAVEDLI